MWHRSWFGVFVVGALAAAGCSKSGGSGGTATAPEAVSDGPAAIVTQFLDAIRTGNDEKAMGLLTGLAHQKAKETNRNPTPPASDTAKFEVGEVELLGADGARVACAWTDLDENGKPHTDHAFWVCRREAEGWRVAGVAAVVFEGEPPLLLDFENPEEMAKKQQWLQEEVARRAKQENPPLETGKNPEDSFRR